MPLALHGLSASAGYAVGRTLLLERDHADLVEYRVPDALLDDEVQRFRTALVAARQQLLDLCERIPPSTPADVTAFLDAHQLMLDDASLTEATVQIIRERHCNAEWALKLQRDRIVRVFDSMDDPYLRARRDDVEHVVRRLLRILTEEDDNTLGLAGVRLDDRIVVAGDLSPADTLTLHHLGVVAVISETGGPLSHSAIIARNLSLPMVIGVRHARRILRDQETVVVDGRLGLVLGDVDESLLQHYRKARQRERRDQQSLKGQRLLPSVTHDGIAIGLHANIDLPEDAEIARSQRAEGIGLYRTEFLYMNRDDWPDEEEHLSAYLHVLRAMEGAPVTVRTADLGADKLPGASDDYDMASRRNPALGLRGVRWSLREQEHFLPQLRAILRASMHGPIRIMVPMLGFLDEIDRVEALLDLARQQLATRGASFAASLPLGGMIEIPAAAMAAPFFARRLDFLSIGTNDLVQYSLAIDRQDDEVSTLYDPLHPGVLFTLHRVIEAGDKAGIPVSLCGEMAGDTRFTRLLLGLGLRLFSLHPAKLTAVKAVIRSNRVDDLGQKVRSLLRTHDAERYRERLDVLLHDDS